MINQAKIILKEKFGYDEFRPLQKEIIENILNKNDTLVIMPTGGGKSLCYQIPALIFSGLTIVVSPLISLMKDQVEQLTEVGVNAIFLNSTLSYEQYQFNISQLKQGKVKLVYLAPETLFLQRTLALFSSLTIDCITIDEAHCISEWGHDFRPEYRKLVEIRSSFPSAVCTALTATATPRVQKDIIDNLKFDTSNEFVASFNRKNLFLQIIPKSNPVMQTIEFLEKFKKMSGIIYCFSRKQVDELYEILSDESYSVRPYHAGLSEVERRQNQELFIRDDVQIIIATIAFGMGINKPNIRFVLHYDLPKSIESYYQEIGRSGRDGLNAHCLLLFGYGDIRKIQYFIKKKEPKEQQVAKAHLNALLQFAETHECRRIPLITYFGEKYNIEKCDMCDVCVGEEKTLVDISIPAQKFLSCVKRTGELFGTGHIIDVLRGSQSQKILKFSHQELSTYGIGKDFSKKQWSQMSRQFLHQGLMDQDVQYGSLTLNKKTYEVFKGEMKVFGFIEEDENNYTESKKKDEQLEYDNALFEILRTERKKLADESNVPPYVIFPDKTLIDFSHYYPQTKESMLNMHGVGTEKLKKYGDDFLEIIISHCSENQINEKQKTGNKPKPQPAKSYQTQKHHIICKAYNGGQSINQLMEHYSIKQTTILDHFYKYINEGYLLKPDGIIQLSTLPTDKREAVFQTLSEIGTELLKPIHEAYDGEISYEELKILRLYYLCRM